MNLARYHARKALEAAAAPAVRRHCMSCQRPEIVCFCSHLRPFPSSPRFVILIHPIEVKRKIATGRMAHLTLSNSVLAKGVDFTHDEKVNAALAAPDAYPLVLYPAPEAVNLTPLGIEARRALVPPGKTPVVVVIDGTWRTSKRMRRESRNLHGLPLISFTPPAPSRFRVRRQPAAECYSTLEAIHHVIELFGPADRRHDALLDVFDHMVEQQLDFREGSGL